MNKNNTFVINMDKSITRLKTIKKNLNKLKIQFTRFSAIDGKNLPNNILYDETTTLCRTILCNKETVGCALSHKYLWKQLLNDKNNDYYIILEDDAVISKESSKIIKKLISKINEYNIDFLNLNAYDLNIIKITPEFRIGDYDFGKPSIPFGFSAYIITKKGAKKILDELDKINYHIDIEVLFLMFFGKVNYYSSYPSVILNTTDTTTIGKKTNCLTLKLMDNIGLGMYSWAINIPLLTINMFYIINIWLVFLLFMLILNKYILKTNILFWFIILELWLFHLIYV
jgi:glycosyl transferase family 25